MSNAKGHRSDMSNAKDHRSEMSNAKDHREMSNANDTKVKSFFYRFWRGMDEQDHNVNEVKKNKNNWHIAYKINNVLTLTFFT